MQLTSYSLDFSINDAPTLILDPDPTEDDTQLTPGQNQDSQLVLQSENNCLKLDADLARSHS
jgi:hypothetical protein